MLINSLHVRSGEGFRCLELQISGVITQQTTWKTHPSYSWMVFCPTNQLCTHPSSSCWWAASMVRKAGSINKVLCPYLGSRSGHETKAQLLLRKAFDLEDTVALRTSWSLGRLQKRPSKKTLIAWSSPIKALITWLHLDPSRKMFRSIYVLYQMWSFDVQFRFIFLAKMECIRSHHAMIVQKTQNVNFLLTAIKWQWLSDVGGCIWKQFKAGSGEGGATQGEWAESSGSVWHNFNDTSRCQPRDHHSQPACWHDNWFWRWYAEGGRFPRGKLY